MAGHSLPPQHLKNSFNSEASSPRLEMSLFADDTTVIGTQEEITEGKKILEEVMRQFEELTNVDKEENLIFGSKESEDVRMLGTWLGRKTDMKHRMQRAGKARAAIRKRFRKCRLSKVTQAEVQGRKRGGCGGVTPPIISTPGPSCNLMGTSRSRSGPVCIEFLFITPLAESSSVGAVIYLL